MKSYRNKLEMERRLRKEKHHVIDNEHGITTTYYHVDFSDGKRNHLLHCSAKLPNGKTVTFFVNRDTNLVVVDIIAKNGKSGNEVLRINADNIEV
jgi:hypothetical protein